MTRTCSYDVSSMENSGPQADLTYSDNVGSIWKGGWRPATPALAFLGGTVVVVADVVFLDAGGRRLGSVLFQREFGVCRR